MSIRLILKVIFSCLIYFFQINSCIDEKSNLIKNTENNSNNMQEKKSNKNIEIEDKMSHAISNVNLSSDKYGFFNHLGSIIQLSVSQRYGDPTYDKLNPFSNYRIYGYTGFRWSTYTRQVLSDVVLDSFLYPKKYSPDFYGRDINAHAKTTLSSSSARVGLFFNPLQGYNQNIYAIVEFDFTGTDSFDQYCMTIKHMFGELTWKNGSILFGQYYHPMFLKESYPRTVNSNQGAPFETISFVPQVRITHFFKPIEITFTMAGQSYIASWGAESEFLGESYATVINIDKYIEDAIVPNINLHIKYLINRNYYGVSIDYLRLLPSLSNKLLSLAEFLQITDSVPLQTYAKSAHKSNKYINSINIEFYAHNVFEHGEINFKAIYTQNGTNLLLISGYAVKNLNPITNVYSYTPTAALSFWLDSYYLFYNKTIQIGIFTGYTQNLGSTKKLYIYPLTKQPIVLSSNFSYSANIDYMFRISSRIAYNKKSFRFGLELAYDQAAYGTLDTYARVINARPVSLFVYLLSLNYVY